MVNDQIYITSINKAINNAKITGDLNLRILSLFNLYNYYIDFTQSLLDRDVDLYEEHNKCFKRKISKLKYKYPDIICNYKNIIFNGQVINSNIPNNTAPTVSNKTIDILDSTIYNFTVADFIVDFTDNELDEYKFLNIYPTNLSNGLLKYNNVELINPITINIENLNSTDTINLTFERTNNSSFISESFNFRISDNNINYLFSSLQNINLLSTSSTTENQPPSDIGDNTIYVSNRNVTILTLFMFTGGLTSPYNDPEGDLIDAIRIIDISNANQGKYYLNGIEVIEGQIITREQIEQGLFTHEAANVDAITSDTFQFQARDEGSQIWID